MSMSEVDIVKFEKEKAMVRYQRFIKIANIATTLEFCFAVIFLSWSISRSSAYFPVAVHLCRFFLRRLCTLVANHHFVFLLGNLIVLTLLLKSGHSATKNRSIASAGTADADENYLIRQFLQTEEVSVSVSVSDEKFILPTRTEVDAVPRRSRRTRSEEFELEMTEKIQLRRSETEPRRRSESSELEESAGKRWMQVEDLSNEEFQRKVEAFIEQQQRFLREECTITPSSASQTLN